MESVYDIRKLLMKFGTIIYIGDRLADLELMEEELGELYEMKLITNDEFIKSKLIVTKEKEKLN